ncbi:thioredoxin family protein [Lederbergia sp. NSJ-179]|uniref:TlpA family protein disulfide reductase n=1 Tax=Lederbergia sp. NSJ-179 TaxID=2931402 RepID=UPI001FD3B145|nr:thioredoxin-like domain-containing protein [Lederbergia sp. NSJ-179]MCJ7841921.1 thioredoxin family protein [Lederbergia sp. NSJ-179]
MLLEVVVLVILIVVIIQSILLYSLGMHRGTVNEGVTAGTVVPSVKLETMDNKSVRLPHIIQDNHYNIICVVSPNCKHCKKIIPLLEEQAQNYSVSIGLLFFGNQQQEVHHYINSNNIKLDAYLVSMHEVRRRLNISTYPFILVINRQGVIMNNGKLHPRDIATWFSQAKSA